MAMPLHIVVLAGAAALFVLTGGKALHRASGDLQSIPEKRLLEERVSIPSSPVVNPPGIRRWEAPRPQSEDGRWLYDLFTPPEIYIHPETRLFSVIPYTESNPEIPFGIELVGIEELRHRLRLEGYIEEDLNNPQKTLLRIYNYETGRTDLVRVGDVSVEGEYRVADFTVSQLRDADGMLTREAVVVIDDLRTDNRYRLKSGAATLSGKLRIHFKPTDSRQVTYTVMGEVGELFRHDGSTYTVTDLDVKAGRVRVDKTQREGERVHSRILVIPENNRSSKGTINAHSIQDHESHSYKAQ